MNPTRTTLLIPPYFNADDYVRKERAAVLPPFTIPYGVLSLEAYLKENCGNPVEITILDLNITLRDLLGRGEKDYSAVFREEIRQHLERHRPDIVGISALFNSSFHYLGEFAAVCKDVLPESLVVSGGGLPSAAYLYVLDLCGGIDAVCKGEGEIAMRALVDSSDRRATLLEHPSWICRQGLKKGKVPVHTFVEDLDEIPPLNYGLINLDNYNSRSIDKRFTGIPKREMAIHTSRGCPFLCVFCSNPSLHGRRVRTMSLDNVVAEVRRMKDEFGMDVLLIEDDHFFHDKARAKEILKRMIELRVRIEFPNGVAVYAIDDDLAGLFSTAGVSSVALAVESGSDFVLNQIIKKPLKKKLIKPAVEVLRKHGVMSHAFIVLGLPGETDEHREETRQMLLQGRFDWVHVFCAIPIFGSRLYDMCIENDYIENINPLDFVNTKSVIRAPGVDPQKIEEFAYDLNLQVNFVHNANMELGRPDVAAKYFANVCSKYPDHALAHYCLGKALEASGDDIKKASFHVGRFREIVETDQWWRRKIERYGPGFLQEARSSTM